MYDRNQSFLYCMPYFANIFANELFSTVQYWKALLGTKLTTREKQDNSGCHSKVLGSTIRLYLLISGSQVRVLYGVPKLEDRPHREVLKRIRVSRH